MERRIMRLVNNEPRRRWLWKLSLLLLAIGLSAPPSSPWSSWNTFQVVAHGLSRKHSSIQIVKANGENDRNSRNSRNGRNGRNGNSQRVIQAVTAPTTAPTPKPTSILSSRLTPRPNFQLNANAPPTTTSAPFPDPTLTPTIADTTLEPTPPDTTLSPTRLYSFGPVQSKFNYITLYGIPALPDQQQWATATSTFINSFFRQSSFRILDAECTIEFLREKTSAENNNDVDVLYSQTMTYKTSDDQALSEELVSGPFYRDDSRRDYLLLLRGINPAYGNVRDTSIAQPLGDVDLGTTTSSTSSNGNTMVIVGGVTGGVLFCCCMCCGCGICACLMWKFFKKDREDLVEGDDDDDGDYNDDENGDDDDDDESCDEKYPAHPY